jgi:hypothetical protein
MFTNEMFKAYIDYAMSHNENPESEITENRLQYLSDLLFDNFDSELVDQILDILATIDNENKLNVFSNLKKLSKIIPVAI